MKLLTNKQTANLTPIRPPAELCIPLTPTKGRRPVFGELTNTINLSPEKLNDSSLRALFTAPTLTTPKTKAKGGANTPGYVGAGGGEARLVGAWRMLGAFASLRVWRAGRGGGQKQSEWLGLRVCESERQSERE